MPSSNQQLSPAPFIYSDNRGPMSQRPIRHYPPLSQSGSAYSDAVNSSNSNSPLIVTAPINQMSQPHHRCKCIQFIRIRRRFSIQSVQYFLMEIFLTSYPKTCHLTSHVAIDGSSSHQVIRYVHNQDNHVPVQALIIPPVQQAPRTRVQRENEIAEYRKFKNNFQLAPSPKEQRRTVRLNLLQTLTRLVEIIIEQCHV